MQCHCKYYKADVLKICIFYRKIDMNTVKTETPCYTLSLVGKKLSFSTLLLDRCTPRRIT